MGWFRGGGDKESKVDVGKRCCWEKEEREDALRVEWIVGAF